MYLNTYNLSIWFYKRIINKFPSHNVLDYKWKLKVWFNETIISLKLNIVYSVVSSMMTVEFLVFEFDWAILSLELKTSRCWLFAHNWIAVSLYRITVLTWASDRYAVIFNSRISILRCLVAVIVLESCPKLSVVHLI